MSEQQHEAQQQQTHSPNQTVNAILALIFGSVFYLPLVWGVYTLLWNFGNIVGRALVVTFSALLLFAVWYALVWLFTGIQLRWSLSYTTHISSSIIQRGNVVVHINGEGYVRNLSAETAEAGARQNNAIVPRGENFVDRYTEAVEYYYDQGTPPDMIAHYLKVDLSVVHEIMKRMLAKGPKQEEGNRE